MKWTDQKVTMLKDLCKMGSPNKDIASMLGVDIKDVYAKRSQLGITIDKCRDAAAVAVDPEPEPEPTKEDFALEVIAQGSFVDRDTGGEGVYLVEAYTLRLNHVALNEWLFSDSCNTRDCFETDQEWHEHQEKYRKRRWNWEEQILSILGIDRDAGSICISQALSEIFTVVHIKEI